MKPRHWIVAALGMTLCTVSCVPTLMPPRGVSVDRLHLTAEPVVSMSDLFPETKGLQHAMDIGGDPLAPSRLVIVGSHGVAWIDREGNLAQWARYEGAASLFPVRMLEPGPGELGFLGLDGEWTGAREWGEVIRFDDQGRRVGTFPGEYDTEFFAADLVGDPTPEVVVDADDGLGVDAYSLDGARLWGYRSRTRETISELGAIDLDGDGHSEVALYLYPVEDAAAVRILDGATGEVLSTWSLPPSGGFAPVRTLGGVPGFLVAQGGEEIRIYGVDGTVLETLDAPEVGKFSRLASRLLPDGGRVTLASGGVGLKAHLLLIHAADGRLLYRRLERDRGQGLYVDLSGAGTTIYYGVGETVWALHGLS